MEKVKIQFISYHTRDYYGWIRYINVKKWGHGSTTKKDSWISL